MAALRDTNYVSYGNDSFATAVHFAAYAVGGGFDVIYAASVAAGCARYAAAQSAEPAKEAVAS